MYEGLEGENIASFINDLHAREGSVAGTDGEGVSDLAKRADDSHRSGIWLDDDPAANSSIRLTKYLASIQLDTGYLNGSFTLFLFDGDSNKTDPSEWRCCKSLIGFHGFFLSNSPSRPGFRIRAVVSIPDTSFPPDFQDDPGRSQRRGTGNITDLVKQRLDWRIVNSDGFIKDANDFPGVDIIIIRSEVEIPCNGSNLPVWEDFTVVATLTDHNVAGCD